MKNGTTLLAALALGSGLCAQSASAIFYGTPCTFANQVVASGIVGLPQVGTTFSLQYAGPLGTTQQAIVPVLALGLQLAAVPIPATLFPLQPANCTQWLAPDALFTMPSLPSGGFQTTQSITVPNQATLLGFHFHAQWYAAVIPCGSAGCSLGAVLASDAVALTVGT